MLLFSIGETDPQTFKDTAYKIHKTKKIKLKKLNK